MITIELRNPPAGGNYWLLTLYNEVWGDYVLVGEHIPVDQPMTLEELPAGWTYPLYLEVLIYESAVSPYNVIYRVQSAYGPDWPNYKDITIPGEGSYYVDITELAPPTQDWTSIMGVVLVLGMVAMLVPAMKKGFS